MGGLGLDGLREDIAGLKAWSGEVEAGLTKIEDLAAERIRELQDRLMLHERVLDRYLRPIGDGNGGEVLKRLGSVEARVGRLAKDLAVLRALTGGMDGKAIALASVHSGGDSDGGDAGADG